MTGIAAGSAFVAGVCVASSGWHAVLATTSGALHGRLGAHGRGALTLAANAVVIALGVRILVGSAVILLV